MGLAISVGYLAGLIRIGETEGIAYFEQTAAAVNRLLVGRGLPPHDEPRTDPAVASRCSLGSFPYSTLHYLRRAYAHRVNDPDWVATPLPEGEDPTLDEVLESESEMFASHLLCHSDSEGWYVPVDFDDVIFGDDENDLPGGMLGSTQRLREELALVAPALDISLDANDELTDAEAARLEAVDTDHPLWRELFAWFALWEAERISLACRCAIVFS